MTQVEFLVHISIDASGVPADDLTALREAEARRAKQLAEDGTLRRLWRLQEGWSNCGLWRAASLTELRQQLATLPLYPWMDVRIEELSAHPSDPGLLG